MATGTTTTTAVKPDLTLRRMRVLRFRSLEDVEVEFTGGMTILVGANNAGKTALLHALGVAVGTAADIDDIQVLADGTRADDFVIYLEFQVDLSLSPGGAGILGTAIQSGTKLFVRARGKLDDDSDQVRLEREYVIRWPMNVGDTPPSTKQALVLRAFRRLVVWTYLDAQRDLAAQVGKLRSRLGRMLADLQLDAAKRKEIEGLLQATSKELFDGSPVLQAIRRELERGLPVVNLDGTHLTVEPVASDVEQIARTADVTMAAPGGPKLPLARHGMGTRSLSDVLLVHADVRLSEAKHRPDDARPLFLSAFEEPEAHLHPTAVHAVASLIDAIPGQQVVTTHAPGLVQATPSKSLVIVTRPTASTRVRIIGRESSKWFPDEAVCAKVERQICINNADLPFARVVVLLEGATERMTLPDLYATQRQAPDRGAARGVLWVDMDGVGKLSKFARFCALIGVPWIALVDDDQAGDQALAARAADWPTGEVDGGWEYKLTGRFHFDEFVLQEGFVRAAIHAYAALRAGSAADHAIEAILSRFDAGHDVLLEVRPWLSGNKGSIGTYLAASMSNSIAAREATLPVALGYLFDRIDIQTGRLP